ncbi:MAG: hypothetical protein E7663_00035 [Ruminococcaceae bacterium]|nr:hypothetical protein [Oscillospiraceae bacterium]
MIRILYGAGSDSTARTLLDAIRQDIDTGKRAILLVPEQEAVSAERRLLHALPPSSQLRFEVLNFTRLANRVFRTVGGLAKRYASPAVSALFMWRTLHSLAGALSCYSAGAALDPRLTDRMLSAAAQFKAYCVSPDMLLDAADRLEKEDPLRDKLSDLGLVISTYDRALGAAFADSADDISRATELILRHGLFSDTHVYVDSFTDFTAQELRLLEVLMKTAPSLTMTSPLRSGRDEAIHLASASTTHRRILRLAKEAERRIFLEPTEDLTHRGATSSVLAYLSRHLFDMSAEPAPLSAAESGELEMTVCSSPFAEAEYAAATISRLVREGCRYRDITVILRDAAASSGIIGAALERDGIPYFLSEKTDITTSPLIKLILFALRIRIHNWQGDDIVGFLKTGLCGVDTDDINCFEQYCGVWRLHGRSAFEATFTMNPDGYAERVSARGERILPAANRVREAIVPLLGTFFDELDDAACAADMCRALYRFLQALSVPESLKREAGRRLAAGERREAQELSRLWDITVEAIDAICSTVGEEAFSASELLDALRLVFERTDIGTIPTSADEVTVGSASTLRAERTRYAVVLGLNEGIFPRAVGDDGLISDAEKQRLAELGIELSADTATSASDELFYVHRALTLPREKLFLSYAESSADGRVLAPSLAVERIRALFPKLRVAHFDALDPLSKIYTPNGAMEHLPELSPALRRRVLALLSENEARAEQIAALSTPVTEINATVSPERASTLFGKNAFNPTGLEKYATCRFAYYCSKILRLREEPIDTLGSAAVGIFMHYILEHIFDAVNRNGGAFDRISEERTEALVQSTVADYREHLLRAGGKLTPRAEALISRLTELARLVISSLFAEFADSLFVPAFLELDLTGERERASVLLRNGGEIPLSGKADRVDVYRAEDGKVYLRVADYKTGRKSFRAKDIPDGFCLQMPLYLFALCRGRHPELAEQLGLDRDTVFHPAGVTYLSTAITTDNTPAREDRGEALSAAAKRIHREGLLLDDKEILRAMSLSGSTAIIGGRGSSKQTVSAAGFDELFEELSSTVSRISAEMKSGTATIAPRKNGGTSPCNYCAFAPICRAAQKEKKKA